MEKPMNVYISPLIMIYEKSGSDNRTIDNLSWPHGFSVNDGYPK